MRAAAALLALGLLAGCSSSADDGATEAAATTPTAPSTTTTAVPSGPVPSAGCGAGTVPPAGVTDERLTSGGDERRYLLTLPEGYDGTTPLPVVFALHSLTVNYTIVPALSGLDAMAADYDVIGVSPSGFLEPTPYWIAAPSGPNRDLIFLLDLLDHLEAELCVDTAQVFSTGLSNGGQMSSLLACEASDRITAVAPVAGVEFAQSCQVDPVPVMAFHGDADPIVPYAGGGLDAATIADQNAWHGDVPAGVPQHEGVDAAMANWADHNGCDPEPTEERISPEVIRRTWVGCDAETVLYVVEGGGHNLPGQVVAGFEDQFGHTTTDIDATALMYAFFLGPPA